MHPIEGEFRRGRREITEFHIAEDNLEQNFTISGKRTLRVYTYPAFRVGHVTIFDPSLRVDREYSSHNGFLTLEEAIGPGQELKISQKGWALTVKNNNPL